MHAKLNNGRVSKTAGTFCPQGSQCREAHLYLHLYVFYTYHKKHKPLVFMWKKKKP